MSYHTGIRHSAEPLGCKERKKARDARYNALKRVSESRAKNPALPPQPELTKEQKAACDEVRLEAYARAELMGEPHEVDHVVELSAGGLEAPDNLQALTRRNHRAKTNRFRWPDKYSPK